MLKFSVKRRPRKLKGVWTGCGSGPSERIKYLRHWVGKLIRDERIEGREDRMNETRGYAEQLISLAIQNGENHRPTMEMATKWFKEKEMTYKLFKVLVPRYENYQTSFTRIQRLPIEYPGNPYYNVVLELKGNPYPSIFPEQRDKAGLLNNILIEAAKKDFYNEHRQSQVVRDSMERDIVGLERDTLQVRMDKSGSGKVENVKTGSTDGTDVDKL
ncbi:39S ribosomal protein L17, mitochondrial-like [Dreissena polymorpha]|uniref:39S ribosomal protein L17, mitochondrial-like n=1 Tax=Dreissena polymorpha TaxID=45954 RepID=UPI002264B318|nr:39S ribosomal protein L17, mitochondrial-like [Dreissena polymorpha]